MSNVLYYIVQKRYGVFLRFDTKKEAEWVKKQSPQWDEFIQKSRVAKNHPYSHYNFELIERSKHHSMIFHINNRREVYGQLDKLPTRAFYEYYKLDKCVEAHKFSAV